MPRTGLQFPVDVERTTLSKELHPVSTLAAGLQYTASVGTAASATTILTTTGQLHDTVACGDPALKGAQGKDVGDGVVWRAL